MSSSLDTLGPWVPLLCFPPTAWRNQSDLPKFPPCWECKMAPPLWKTVWRCLKKLKMQNYHMNQKFYLCILTKWEKNSSLISYQIPLPCPPKHPEKLLQLDNEDRKLWCHLNRSKNTNLRVLPWPLGRMLITMKNTTFFNALVICMLPANQ